MCLATSLGYPVAKMSNPYRLAQPVTPSVARQSCWGACIKKTYS